MSAVGVGRSLSRSVSDARRIRMVGDTASHARRKDDFYATPPEAVAALLSVERFEGDILEPACGDGAISRVLEAAGHDVRSTDLVNRGYGEGGLDFLSLGYPYRAANVVTNPPFKLGEAFLERALLQADGKVALLLRQGFLEGGKRARMLRASPLARVWTFAERLTFRIPDRAEQGGGMLCFAWFVWDRAHRGPPTHGWLFRDEYQAPAPQAEQASLFPREAA
jgi:hypothetical protein